MGNRANLVFNDKGDLSPAIYLHWEGGFGSVLGFINELRRRGHTRMDYAPARLCCVIGEYMGRKDGLSLGLLDGPNALTPQELKHLDHGDNGIYVVESIEEMRVFNYEGANSKPKLITPKDFSDYDKKKFKSLNEYYLEVEKRLEGVDK